MGNVQPFIALQPDEISLESRCGSRRQRCLADAGLPFQKEWLAQSKREEQRHGEPTVGHVVVAGQPLLELGDGFGRRNRRVV
jgi:hypothetical protein